MRAIYVEVTATRGSAPRDAGAAMKVTPGSIDGTIGGGALEHQAIAHARQMLAEDLFEGSQTLPPGPGLGQCCGGAVTLRYSTTPRPLDTGTPLPLPNVQSDAPLWIWGAGHVGRAVVAACPPRAFDLTWIDSAPDRFPDHVPPHVTVTPAADMPRLAAHAPRDAHHLIFTYSHDIDLALCAALLQRGAASIGLIGSDTKKARFSRRLGMMGLDPSGIICPIGEKSLGKLPAQIAHGTLQALIARTQTKVSA